MLYIAIHRGSCEAVQAALHLCAAALPNHYCRDNFAVLLALGSAAGLLLRILASRVLALIVYSATPRDPLVLAGAVLAMSLMGLLATWIPARRALSVDPLILLREDE